MVSSNQVYNGKIQMLYISGVIDDENVYTVIVFWWGQGIQLHLV